MRVEGTLPGAPGVFELDSALARGQALGTTASFGPCKSRRHDRRDSGERLPRRWRDRTRRLRQDHPARAMGATRGSSGRLGVAGQVRRRSRDPAHPAGLRLRSGLARQRRPGRRHEWPVRRTRWAAPRPASPRRSESSPEPFVLMVDDLHELQAPGLPRRPGRGDLGDPGRVPAGGASRFEQPHLPRLRASGDAVELDGSRPGPDVAGAEQIFAEADVGVSREAGGRGDRTDRGLAGGPLPGGDDRTPRPRSGGSGDGRRPLRGRLPVPRVLVLLPKPMQRFLRRTAILDQLSAPLCDAVLGESGGQAAAARAGGVELVPGPARPSPGVVPLPRAVSRVPPRGAPSRRARRHRAKLHLRAADWYESNGSPTWPSSTC